MKAVGLEKETDGQMAKAASSLEPLTDAPESQEAGPLAWPSRRQLFVGLLCYFGIHVIIRTFLSSSVDLDESEQVLFAQRLRWGYGPQPPLYSWLQIGFFSLFGQLIFSLALLKNLLLVCTYCLTYTNARLVTRSHAAGVAAAVSLLFIPQVVWESQRDLTHSVLSATLSAAACYCLLRVLATRRAGWYLLLGICAGLGLLSKLNFGLWIGALILASFSVRELRPAVVDKRILLTAAMCVLAFLPYGIWMLTHDQLAFGGASKLKLQASGEWLKPAAVGIRNLLVAVASFAGPLVLAYVAIFFKAPKSPVSPGTETAYEKLILRALLFTALLTVSLVLGFRATGFRDRWLQPLLITTPVLLISMLRDRLDPLRLRRLMVAGGMVALAVTIMIPGRILFGAKVHREEPLMRPYAALAAQMRSAIPSSSFRVADTGLLAGNLRLALGQQTVVTPSEARLFNCREPHCLLVWDARGRDLPPQALLDWAQTWATTDLSQVPPRYFTATYKFHDPRQMRLGMLIVK